jgi:S1-C subfamily serine protease
MRNELRRSAIIFAVLFSLCLAVAAPAMADDYYVQVSSQRSVAEVLAAYRSLQNKFPNELGNRQARIHRVDLDQGSFFRAMVGPFTGSQEAVALCSNLRAAGGQCLVQVDASLSSTAKEPSKPPAQIAPSLPKLSPKLSEPTPAPGPAFQTAMWTPLSKDLRHPPLRNKQTAEELFAKARTSVWVVIGTTSQGSAVAITRSLLITNYHVVKGQRFVFVKQGSKVLEATVVGADKTSDRCVLSVKEDVLIPVDGLRNFEELRVGESVYTIGSPSSLESTLGQGIVSGLRTVEGRHLVQTTAQISPGSSGGGLFDGAGNLVGITRFTLKNSQGLNFAIAVEDYFH